MYNNSFLITFITCFLFIFPLLYSSNLFGKYCKVIFIGCLLCFVTSLLNHGANYFNIERKKIKFFELLDRIICHFCIIFFIIYIINFDIYYISSIFIILIIFFIYYFKLQYIVIINNKIIKKKRILACSITLFSYSWYYTNYKIK